MLELSSQELKVFKEMIKGLDIKEVSETLGVPVRRIYRLCEKMRNQLGCKNNFDLGVRLGMVFQKYGTISDVSNDAILSTIDDLMSMLNQSEHQAGLPGVLCSKQLNELSSNGFQDAFLAKEIGVSRTTIYKIKNQMIANPRVSLRNAVNMVYQREIGEVEVLKKNG